ncbi:MAG TPA: SDR family oxidoreductase [Nitrososphaera sp.]|jgi:3-oxoacyl-[acyl-carrier protein] reductase
MAAIVTGSGRGIGKETAVLLAKKGINVVVCARNSREVNETVSEIRQFHLGVIGIACDVGVAAQVNGLVKKTTEHFGGVDILVNNAAVLYLKQLVNTTEGEWDETIASNLKSAFLCSKAVLPDMKRKNSGTIINVSSVAGKTGYANLSAYCASKFGMMGMTESLAWEIAGNNIRVMSICPGEVDTDMQDVDPDYRKENAGEMLKPEQVAEKIVEMAFDRKYRNGQSVDI